MNNVQLPAVKIPVPPTAAHVMQPVAQGVPGGGVEQPVLKQCEGKAQATASEVALTGVEGPNDQAEGSGTKGDKGKHAAEPRKKVKRQRKLIIAIDSILEATLLLIL